MIYKANKKGILKLTLILHSKIENKCNKIIAKDPGKALQINSTLKQI